MIVWPAELPQRSDSPGFSETIGEGRLRSPMENGPPKVRRRFSTAVRSVQLKLFLDLNQKARLMRFWDEDCRGGTLPFLLPDQISDGAELLDSDGNTILDTNGNVITIASWWVVTFGEQPPAFSTPSYGEIWTASFPISVMP